MSTEQKEKTYSYTKDGKTKNVKRSWKVKGEKKAKRDTVENYLRDNEIDLSKQSLKKYYEEFKDKNPDVSVSYSMFYKYYVQLNHKIRQPKEEPKEQPKEEHKVEPKEEPKEEEDGEIQLISDEEE